MDCGLIFGQLCLKIGQFLRRERKKNPALGSFLALPKALLDLMMPHSMLGDHGNPL